MRSHSLSFTTYVAARYAALKWATDARIAALEARQGHDNETFEAYEQMERELDEVVMQAADASDPSDTLMGYA